jgi:CMP-N-acetylneuraminic acid synthetase
MKVLGLIPARGGSKGIPRKNVRTIAGKPLIAWTIEAALRSSGLAKVIVSTDDDEIAAAARAVGAEVPFRRPAELAADNTPGVEPVLHAIDQLPEHDAVLLLQPTSPLRTAGDIDALLAVAERTGAPSIVSVCEPDHHPAWMYRLGDGAVLEPLMPSPVVARRQDLPTAYALNGAMYFAHCNWLRLNRAFLGPETVGHPMPPERSVDIDTWFDWRLAEMLLAGLSGSE